MNKLAEKFQSSQKDIQHKEKDHIHHNILKDQILRETDNTEMLQEKYQKHNIHPPYQCTCIHCNNFNYNLCDNYSNQLHLSINSDISDIAQQKARIATIKNDKRMRISGEFFSLLHKLIPPKKQRPLDINILDTIFYSQKEANLLVYNNFDLNSDLNFTRSRDKLTFDSLRLFLTKRRIDYNMRLKLKQMRTKSTGGINQKVDESKAIRDMRIQYVSQLNNQDVQFAQFFFNTNSTCQMISFQEFNTLMLKKRSDTIWERVFYMQSNMIEKNTIINSKFTFERDKDKLLFKRALEDVLNRCQMYYERSKWAQEEIDYVKVLQENNFQQYLDYMGFKIHHYIEIHYNLKLMRVIIEWIKDTNFDTYYIVNCRQLAFSNINSIEFQDYFQHYIKYYTEEEQEWFIQQLQQGQEKQKEQLEQKIIKYSKTSDYSNRSQRFKRFDNYFQSQNEILKQEYIEKIEDMQIQMEKREDIIKTNEIFKSLNPESKQNFFELVLLERGENLLHFKEKQNIMNNFPNHQRKFNNELDYYISQHKDQFQKHLKAEPLNILNVKRPQTQQSYDNVKKGQQSVNMKTQASVGTNSGIDYNKFEINKTFKDSYRIKTYGSTISCKSKLTQASQNLKTQFSRNIQNKQLQHLMSDKSPILDQSRKPTYLRTKGMDFYEALPVILYTDPN